MSDLNAPPALRASGISKSYGAIAALDKVGLTLNRGEIHALVGHNGAGKSSLLNVLAGIVRPDSGTVEIHGQAVSLNGVRDSERYGIGLVHQHLELADNLTVSEAISLGREPKRSLGRLDRQQMRELAAEVLRRTRADVDVDAQIGRLNLADRQLCAIARSLVHAREILLLDEPTSALGLAETGRLYEVLRGLADSGFAVMVVTHRLSDVLDHCDRVTVLRGGQPAGEMRTAEIDERDLLRAMLGHELEALPVDETPATRAWLVEVSGAGFQGPLRWRLPVGRITGLFGVPGSGREELMRALVGRSEALRAELQGPEGERLSKLDPGLAEIGFVPTDRRRNGLFTNLTLSENVVVNSRAGLTGGRRSRRLERQLTSELIESISIKGEAGSRIDELSGGNQQKVVLARAIAHKPKVLLLDEPTLGVDVGSRQDIYRTLRELASSGSALLVASQDEEELIQYCDSIHVLAPDGMHGPMRRPFERREMVAIATGVGSVSEAAI